MKLAIALLISVAALLIVADRVDATAQCQPGSPTADTCMGVSGVGTTTGGTLSGRCLYFTVQSVAPPCSTGGIITTGNQAAWELDPSGCTTLYYHNVANGAVPPATPNKLTLSIFYDDTSTAIRTYQSLAAPPATGTGHQLCATNDGTSTGSPRSGPALILIRAVKDNGNGLPGNTNYDIIMTGTGTQDTSFDIGFIRFKTTVSNITHSAYPSGSTFAYGASADESITITGSFTTPAGDSNRETMFTSILDESTLLVGQAGSTVDVDSGSLAQSFVVDSTFPFANSPYDGCLTIVGNGYNGLKHTRYTATGHGATINRISDTFACNTADFNIDSRIKMDSDTTGGFASADETDRSYTGGSCSGSLIEVFNHGETICTAWSLVNARDQYLSRSMTFARRDSVNTVCSSYGSLSPTANVYTITGSLSTGGTCLAANDITGLPRHILTTNTDQSYASGTVYSVSTLYFVDTHLQLSNILVADDYPTEDANEDLQYFVRSDGSGGDDSDTIHLWCGVQGVRKDLNIDTSGNAISANIQDPTSTVRESDMGDSDTSGFTTGMLNLLATTPLGDDWEGNCSVSFNGNTGADTEMFEVSVEGGGGTVIVEEILHVGDPLKVFCEYYALNESVLCTISESYLDGTARTGNAADTDVYLYAPDHSLVVNGDQPTEVAFGSYYYEYANATEGTWLALIRTMNETGVDIGTSNLFTIDFTLLEHRESSLELFSMENVLLVLFFVLMIVAEWKKDLIYHLIVVIMGITIVAAGAVDSNLRFVIVALMIYQIYRAYLVSKVARNSLDNPMNKED